MCSHNIKMVTYHLFSAGVAFIMSLSVKQRNDNVAYFLLEAVKKREDSLDCDA